MDLKLHQDDKLPRAGLLAGLLLGIFILGYGLFEAYDLLCGPTLTITNPSSGLTVHNSLVQVKGATKRIAKIFIGGRQVFAQNDGSFNEPLLLAYGYNIIEVKVVDQFGRQITKKLEVMLD